MCSGLCVQLVCGEKVHLARCSPSLGEEWVWPGKGSAGSPALEQPSAAVFGSAGAERISQAGHPSLGTGARQAWPLGMGTLPGDCQGAASAPSPLHSCDSCWVCRSCAGSLGVSEPFIGPEKTTVGFGLSVLAVGALLAIFSPSAVLCSMFPHPGLLLGACLHLGILSHRPIYFDFFPVAMGLWFVAQDWSALRNV